MRVDEQHWLDVAKREPIKGGNPMNTRRCLVFHYTSGASALSSIEFMRDNGLSAHLVIDRDGTIYQCRPFNRTCGHAGAPGKARWQDPKTGIMYGTPNSYGIGVEIANAGDDKALARRFSRLPLLSAAHRNDPTHVREWEQYTDAQISACVEIARTVVKRYNLDDVTGHDCVAPERKDDPGPAFPMKMIREKCGFSGLPKVHKR